MAAAPANESSSIRAESRLRESMADGGTQHHGTEGRERRTGDEGWPTTQDAVFAAPYLVLFAPVEGSGPEKRRLERNDVQSYDARPVEL